MSHFDRRGWTVGSGRTDRWMDVDEHMDGSEYTDHTWAAGCRDDRAGSEGCAEGSRGVVPRGREGCAGGGKRVVPGRARKEGNAGGEGEGDNKSLLVCRYDRPGLWGCALKKITTDHVPTC